jgi:REP element-mobilizing transposase RayT
MTAPRQILPGATYLLTRRCACRLLLLRPSPLTNAIFHFVLADAARRFGIEIHAYCVLSNHWHAVVTDPEARLPGFLQQLDSLVARAVNALLGRWESFWAPASYSAVTLVAPEDIVEKTAYVLANPVAAGLVRSGRDWPGLWSAPESIGAGPTTVKRPDFFFRQKGKMPEVVELELTAPPGFGSAEAFRERVLQALAAKEAEAVANLEAAERGFLGGQRVLAQEPASQPATAEPRRQLNPRIAGRDKWKRVEAIGRLVEFLRRYRAALRAFREGVEGVVFPRGTYLLRVTQGVPCEGFG